MNKRSNNYINKRRRNNQYKTNEMNKNLRVCL